MGIGDGRMCGTRMHHRKRVSAGNMYVFVIGKTTSVRVDSVEKCASIKFIGLPPCDRFEQIKIISGKKSLHVFPRLCDANDVRIMDRDTFQRHFVDGKKQLTSFFRYAVGCVCRKQKF